MSGNLDDILNDALNDFDFEDTTKANIGNTAGSAPSVPAEEEKDSKNAKPPISANPAPSMPSGPGEEMDEKWAEEFLSKLNSDDPEMKKLMQQFQASFEAATQGQDGGASSSSSSVPLPNLPDMNMDSEEMMKKVEELQKMLANVENGEDDEESLDRILEATGMSKMMETLMSKDVLLEPFKEMDTQYVEWFDKNVSSLNQADLTKYKQQHEIVKKIISAYETSGDNASEVVATLLSEMQALGDPPKGLLQTMLPDLKFDDEGKPIMPM